MIKLNWIHERFWYIMNSKISILIPTFNRERYIKEVITSALNQTYKNIEIIVVDNKSTDNSWAILKDLAKNDGRIKLFQKRQVGWVSV